MNLQTIQRYILELSALYTKNGVYSKSLDMLEQFAWEKHLSAYRIFSNLKSNRFMKMAYKNVNKRVNALLLSGLIQETEFDDETNTHNAKYYKLTEYGIYQLFLNRLHSINVNQSDVRKGKVPSSSALTFFRNYSNSKLLEIFIYPYIKKDSISAIGDYLLLLLYRYLNLCCGSIQKYLKGKSINIPVVDVVFSWNNIPGKDNEKLLMHLQQIFNLESVEPYTIKKDDTDENPTITVKTPSAHIVIRRDKVGMKAAVMSTYNSQFEQFQYDVFHLGREVMIGNRIPYEESIKDIISDAKKQIEQLIYWFVYDLASFAKDHEKENEISYYVKVLSDDNKFISAIREIYENRHKGFEKGYKMLTNRT
jgi:hypothetical protein